MMLCQHVAQDPCDAGAPVLLLDGACAVSHMLNSCLCAVVCGFVLCANHRT